MNMKYEKVNKQQKILISDISEKHERLKFMLNEDFNPIAFDCISKAKHMTELINNITIAYTQLSMVCDWLNEEEEFEIMEVE
ncbi:MAG: hypothetical protein ACK5LC_14060 [Coprobacillaceae bacterium]